MRFTLGAITSSRWNDELIGTALCLLVVALSGVRLGEPENKAMILNAGASAVDVDSLEIESQPGVEASPRALQSAVGLVALFCCCGCYCCCCYRLRCGL